MGAVGSLRTILKHTRSDCTLDVCQALWQTQPEALLAEMLRCLEDTDIVVRRLAAWLFASMPSAWSEDRRCGEVAAALARGVEDSDRSVRYFSVMALAWSGSFGRAGVPGLRRVLQGGDRPEREMALATIQALGPVCDGLIPDLVACLKDDDVAEMAALALAFMGAKARPALGALREALSDEASGVRAAAQDAIDEIESAAQEPPPSAADG
jgi:hypothetical protein